MSTFNTFSQAAIDHMTDGYVVFLKRADRDIHGHNGVFIDELMYGFQNHGLAVRYLDYVHDVRQVTEAMNDPKCRFFACFNGFGSELMFQEAPGRLVSSYGFFKKPLFDLMHDCPIHESMAHQVESTDSQRHLFATDTTYAHLARLLGLRNVHTVSSITFPQTAPEILSAFESRSIDILLPIGLVQSSVMRERHSLATNYRGRVFREIFEAVTEVAANDLRVDPLIETLLALQQAQVHCDVQDPDIRFLVTSIVDYVKFERRDDLVRSIQHLPVTIIPDRDVSQRFKETSLKFIDSKSFRELIATMADAKAVICPLPHHTGFHERALAAFSGASVVVAAPNEVLETNFFHEQEMLGYSSHEELAALLEDCIDGKKDLESIGRKGHEKAMARFSPDRLADIMVSRYLDIRDPTIQ